MAHTRRARHRARERAEARQRHRREERREHERRERRTRWEHLRRAVAESAPAPAESVVADALARRFGGRTPLVRHVARVAPQLLRRRVRFPVVFLEEIGVRRGWARPLETWRPVGNSPARQWTSLVDHLVFAYPVPAFLRRAVGEYLPPFLEAAIVLGRGLSLHREVEAGRVPGFPPLTRRMVHGFVTSPVGRNPWVALRHAQVEGLGGDRRLADLVGTSEFRGPVADEALGQRMLGWLVARREELARSQVRALLEFFARALAVGEEWEPTGLPVSAVLRRQGEWNADRAALRPYAGVRFPVPSVAGATIRTQESQDRSTEWRIAPILDPAALRDEGRSMEHCVFSYVDDIRSGASTIWSVTQDGERALTVEVVGREIVEVRGPFNRGPRPRETDVIRRWSRRAGLRIDEWAFSEW